MLVICRHEEKSGQECDHLGRSLAHYELQPMQSQLQYIFTVTSSTEVQTSSSFMRLKISGLN